MLNRKHANILIMSSNSGYMLESKPIGFYAMTKTMLISLMKVLSRELHNEHIRVNAIAPGIIKTKFSEALWKGDEKGAEDMMGVKRLGVVEDISSSAAFLCSYEADYITGECLVV